MKDHMKFIRIFTWVTTALYAIGCIVLIDEGTMDIYALWNMVAVSLASYYMTKR